MYAVSVPVEQLVGKTLENYEIHQLLGRGKVSAVFLAQQRSTHNTVMLTAFLLPEQCVGRARERFMERFSLIASKLVRVKHPHILPTYDFGEQFGYPYLITAFVEENSLSHVLNQQTRLTPTQVLALLKQIAEGLDYAHQQEVVHGLLKPANILLDSQQFVHLTGLGLAQILEMRGIGVISHPQPHLFNVAGSFLYSPEYVAPEVVQGAPVDARSDIYALGILLFTLLSGAPPFTGANSFEIAMQHIQRSVPPLQTQRPDVPAALDLVIQRALDRDPARRFQTAGSLVSAFERVLGVVGGMVKTSTLTNPSIPDATLPPTVNWFEEENIATGSLPMIDHFNEPTTGPTIGVTSASSGYNVGPQPMVDTNGWQLKPPIVTGKTPSVKANAPFSSSLPRPSSVPLPAPMQLSQGEEHVDPFDMWSRNAANQANAMAPSAAPMPMPGMMSLGPQRPKPSMLEGRRRVVLTLGIVGGVVGLGLLGGGGYILANKFGGNMHATNKEAVHPGNKAAKPNGNNKNENNNDKGNNQGDPPKAAPMGTQIGTQNQDVNSAQAFTNPADGQKSLLVHLPNGNFAAYEQACTHAQYPVRYDPNTQQLICDLHGSIFDPANNGAVVKGPAAQPLPPVKFQVNGDGTITTG